MGMEVATAPVQTEVWLTLEDVCARLERRRRSVEMLVQQGHIQKAVIPPGPGRRSPTPMFSEASVEEYKRKRDSGQLNDGTALVPVPPPKQQQAPPAEPEEEYDEEPDDDPLDKIPRYAYVTLAEAARIIRMPTTWIEDACAAGRLLHERTRRGGLRIKRADLEDLPARKGRTR